MTLQSMPRVFIDADVLFAGVASPSEHGASLVVLRMSEITLIEAIASQQVVEEPERNLVGYLPHILPQFQRIVDRSLRIVPNPSHTELEAVHGLAEPKDAPILATAIRETCPWLLSFNIRHYQPGHPSVKAIRPGAFVQQVRSVLANLSS